MFIQNETPKFDTMKKTLIYILLPFTLLVVGFASFSAFLSEKIPPFPSGRDASTVQIEYSQKINLALRQAAHRLLKQAGDSTSRIPPIRKTTANTYLVELEYAFSYDSLAVFLHNSFSEHGIRGKYDVAVWDCQYNTMILGYTSFDYTINKEVPCMGRQQSEDCLNFTVTFPDSSSFLAKNAWIWYVLSGLSLGILGASIYFLFFNSKKKIEIVPQDDTQVDETYLVYIGKSIFDTHNQTFTTDDNVQKLTSREAKLLQLFCKNQNELLDRDFILKAVWEDEGVLVTRTVDVFISRLRKILKDDTTLKIVNVHSRGYRFET